MSEQLRQAAGRTAHVAGRVAEGAVTAAAAVVGVLGIMGLALAIRSGA